MRTRHPGDVTRPARSSIAPRNVSSATLRPQRTTATFLPRYCSAVRISPATVTPAAPPTIQRSPSAIVRMAPAISASVTVTVSSMTSWQSGNVTDPGATAPAEPSDSVGRSGVATRWPAVKESSMHVEASGRTPTTRVAALSRFSAVPVPPISPPPPTHTNTASRSGACSASSTPSVPCPATVSRSLYGATYGLPVSSAWRRASCSASCGLPSTSTTSAPSASIAAILPGVVIEATYTVTPTPASCPARATPWPWLPVEAVITPVSRALSPSTRILFAEPRTLNEPVGMRCSVLSHTSHSSSRESRVRRSRVLTGTCGRIPRCASRMRSTRSGTASSRWVSAAISVVVQRNRPETPGPLVSLRQVI